MSSSELLKKDFFNDHSDIKPCFITKLHRNQEHPDKPLLEHTKELIEKFNDLGIAASPLDDEYGGDEDDEWATDDEEDVDEDGDVDME